MGGRSAVRNLRGDVLVFYASPDCCRLRPPALLGFGERQGYVVSASCVDVAAIAAPIRFACQ